MHMVSPDLATWEHMVENLTENSLDVTSVLPSHIAAASLGAKRQ